MFKKILIPVDFTDKNLGALDRAFQLAKWSHGRVILVHVIEKVENISAKELGDFYRKLEANAKKKMNQYAQTFNENKIPFSEEIIYGKRDQEIIRLAVEEDIDLIVLSSHRIDPQTGWGTLSYKVAILSPCPVLLVK